MSLWLDLLGAEIRFHEGKHRTRVIEAGHGEPLVLLHGLGGHAEAWARSIMRLAQTHHVIAIDLLWHGLSSKPTPVSDVIPNFANQVLDVLDGYGIESASIEGESLGGWIGMWMAVRNPQRVRALILNTTTGVAFKPGSAKLRSGPGTDVLRQRSVEAISDPTRESIRRRLEYLVADPDRVTEEMVDLRLAFYTDPDTRAALAALFGDILGKGPSAGCQITEEELAQIQAPTLVFWTDKNPGTKGPEAGARLAELIPGASFYCMKDAGHWPQWEHPEEHDDVVTTFLAKARQGSTWR